MRLRLAVAVIVLGLTGASAITVPLLIIENSADEACPAPDPGRIYAACGSPDKTMHVIKGATHYYQGQPQQMQEALDITTNWLDSHQFLD